ncbi:exostosin-2-like [Clavelina lepadiformis]|uniref:exostosin-2-like n=1 Tax=Clavelina lepadiformis TaxID=159417 RepID=UPI004041BC0A
MALRREHQVVSLIGLVAVLLLLWQLGGFSLKRKVETVVTSLHLDTVNKLPKAVVEVDSLATSAKTDQKCKMHNCFNVYKCGNKEANQITVYLYPLVNYVDVNFDSITPSISKEFYELYSSIASSRYYVDDPTKACIFLPPIDLLNQNLVTAAAVGPILNSLPHWNHGMNNLLFNMLPGKAPDYSTSLDVPHGKAIVAGGGFSHWTYRNEFDVSIPVFSPLTQAAALSAPPAYRKWLLTSAQVNLHNDFRVELEAIASENRDFLLLEKCRNVPEDVPLNQTRCWRKEQKPYPQILQESIFCLILPTVRLGQSALSDALRTGCIPVFVCDTYVLPFSEVLDWKRASIVLYENDLPKVIDKLKKISPFEIKRMSGQVNFFWREYFSSMSSIALTTLQIINDRVFPEVAKGYTDWNKAPGVSSVQSPLFLPLMPPESDGFTAVILAYDRVESMFKLIMSLDRVPSLRLILVIWNNQQKPFPARREWPIIDHDWKVIQTSQNKLSNRFFPYKEIKTEAVLSIDDDIVMLTTDEIEFGYQVWREFPDTLVGYPPRLHLWTEDRHLRYQSEWTNNISIVLTGAAFYHNYFNYLYTYKMPGDIKDWVDEHMNCEDIAMNFVITNHTGKAPIKVSPRKKFLCSECITGGSLSLDETHMVERSTCMNHFMEMYGMLPLKAVNFRADPVLFKDEFPEKMKKFSNIGSL